LKLYIYLIFLSLILISCGSKSSKSTNKINKFPVPSKAKVSWFKMPNRFHEKPEELSSDIHPFFDLKPFWDFNKGTVNFYKLNNIGDKSIYNLDLISGKKYQDKELCYRKDFWAKKLSFNNKTKFVYGIIPRSLNSLQLPLEVIVLGRQKYFYTSSEYSVSQKIKILGALTFQECKSTNCIKSQKWNQREVLIGANIFDPKFTNINNINDLRKSKTIVKISNYIESISGGVKRDTVLLPTSRVLSVISKKNILTRLQNKNKIFKFNEIIGMKKNCLYLYDYLWNEINKSKKIEKTFSKIYTKHLNSFKLCTQYVSYANINDNQKRFWFFTYFANIVNLSKIGIEYNCKQNYWDYDGLLKKEGFKSCTYGKLDQAMRYAPNVNKNLSSKFQTHYRFITYDNSQYGTHQKLYSWVKNNGKKLNCIHRKNVKSDIFPIDVNLDNLKDLLQ